MKLLDTIGLTKTTNGRSSEIINYVVQSGIRVASVRVIFV